MKPITFERYVETFHILEKYSEEYPLMLRHLLDFSENNFPDGFTMLDIGAGTGSFGASFLGECSVPVLGYTAIEPSLDHVERIREKLRETPVDHEIIHDFFSPETQFRKKFDLILLSHCTYCFLPDPEPYLLHAFSFLNEDGRAVIYHGSPTNFCCILNYLHRDILPEGRITDPTFTSWEVRDILDRNGIPYSKTYLPGTLRAGEIFREGNTALLHELITFSLMVEAESIDRKRLERTGEFLREMAYPSAEGPMLNLGVDAIVFGKD